MFHTKVVDAVWRLAVYNVYVQFHGGGGIFAPTTYSGTNIFSAAVSQVHSSQIITSLELCDPDILLLWFNSTAR